MTDENPASAEDALTVVLSRRQDVADQREHLGRGACFVPLPDPPPGPFEELTVVLLAAGSSFEAKSRVVQILAPVGMALECSDPDAVRAWLEERLAAWQRDEPDAGPAFVQWGRPDRAEPIDDAAEAGERPLYERIAQMTSAEKLQLALHGDKTARALLLKDPNKMIHTYIIKNRGITEDEVRYMAGYRQTNPDVLRQIGENREWLKNPRIVIALVTNPKTPSTTATKLLSLLPASELRRLAKSQSVPRAVSAAARRLVVGQ